MKYVRNAWYVAGWAHEVVAGCPLGVNILSDPIVIWRSAAGGISALEDRCIHRLAPLSLGRCEGDNLRCMYHGMLYDRDGRVVEIPGESKIPASMRVRTYPVVERHSWIWVWMGDANAADQRLIPPLQGMDDVDRNEYLLGYGQLDLAAEARLVYENLLDLSHITYLHNQSFKMGDIWARQRPHVTERQNGIRSARWLRGEKSNLVSNGTEAVDTYFCCDCFVPGAVLYTNRTYPVGTADALNDNEPDLREVSVTSVSHAVTPMTSKVTRQFWIVMDRRRSCEAVYDTTTMQKAFAEDKTMIEAQQRNLDASPGFRLTPTSADRAVVLFARLVAKLVLEESAPVAASP